MKKQYTEELKRQIFEAYLQGEKVKEMKENYGISQTTIYSWIREHKLIGTCNNKDLVVKDYYVLKEKYSQLKKDY